MIKLLTVEDSDVYNKVMKKLFYDETKYELFVCRSLQEARVTFENNEIDIVLLDMSLPDGNGKEFINYIREENENRMVFIFSITSEISEESVLEMYEMGTDYYFAKPFNPMMLRAAVKRVAKRIEDQRECMKKINKKNPERGNYGSFIYLLFFISIFNNFSNVNDNNFSFLLY